MSAPRLDWMDWADVVELVEECWLGGWLVLYVLLVLVARVVEILRGYASGKYQRLCSSRGDGSDNRSNARTCEFCRVIRRRLCTSDVFGRLNAC